ncbi:hypothetical protein Tco_0987214 [Tanacetum coccineum]
MEDDFKPAVQHQRRVNPKILEVIKEEVIKLLDAGLIYPISDVHGELRELANTPLNENCSAVLLKKLSKKLGDTRRFLIPYTISSQAYSHLDDPRVSYPDYYLSSRYSRGCFRKWESLHSQHGDESIHKTDILDITCKDHFHEVINVQRLINPLSGNLTPSFDPVVASLSPSLTPFGDSDFILEEIDTFLASNDSTSPDVDDGTFDMEGDIRLIETL